MTLTAAPEIVCPPLHLHVPPYVESYADEVCDLAESVGLVLYPEQRLVVEAATAVDSSGRLVATEFGANGPRQNFKTVCGKALSLADLCLFDIPDALWTAQLRQTSDEAFRNQRGDGLADLFDNYDDLRRLVDDIKDSDGEKSITLLPREAGAPRPKLTFMTRSERGGRGLTGQRVTYDEALYLKPSMLAAMLPVLSAQSLLGDVQVRYLGSAGLLHSAAWRAIRDRGRSGTARRLAWIEFGVDVAPCEDDVCRHQFGTEGCALAREDLVRAANLLIDRRMDIEYVMGAEREGMLALDWAAERLNWWQDPPNTTGGDLDAVRWAGQTDFTVARGKQLVYGIDVDSDGVAWIGIVWERPDGGVQVMLDEPKDLKRVSAMTAPDRVRELAGEYGGRIALGGPASRLEKDLTGLKVELVTAGEFAQACAEFDDLLTAGQVWHQEQDDLDTSVGLAVWRKVGTAGEKAWQLQNAPGIGPLAAVTRALAVLRFKKASPAATPIAASSATSAVDRGLTDSIADQTF